MWFGTAGGLCRYDGHNLTPFSYAGTNEPDPVRAIVRGKMLEDRNGNIWYSNESGIYKWDAVKETVYRAIIFDKREYRNAEFQCIYLEQENTK